MLFSTLTTPSYSYWKNIFLQEIQIYVLNKSSDDLYMSLAMRKQRWFNSISASVEIQMAATGQLVLNFPSNISNNCLDGGCVQFRFSYNQINIFLLRGIQNIDCSSNVLVNILFGNSIHMQLVHVLKFCYLIVFVCSARETTFLISSFLTFCCRYYIIWFERIWHQHFCYFGFAFEFFL